MVKLKGSYPVLITPMKEDGAIDWEGLKSNVEFFISKDVPGIVVNGSTGEFVSLTKEERFQIVTTCVEQIKGRIELIVGTAAETTADTIEYTKQAEEAGADAALIINSYYSHPKNNELYEHFKAVAKSVRFPIMIYNNPFTSGVNMDTDLIIKIGKDMNNITHIKESSGEITKARDIIRQAKSDLLVFCGSEDLALESFLIGAVGWVSVAGNIAPIAVNQLYEFVQEQKMDEAWEVYDQLLPLCKFLEESGKYVQIIKRAMELQGLAGGPARKPRLPLEASEEKRLIEIMENLGVLANEK